MSGDVPKKAKREVSVVLPSYGPNARFNTGTAFDAAVAIQREKFERARERLAFARQELHDAELDGGARLVAQARRQVAQRERILDRESVALGILEDEALEINERKSAEKAGRGTIPPPAKSARGPYATQNEREKAKLIVSFIQMLRQNAEAGKNGRIATRITINRLYAESSLARSTVGEVLSGHIRGGAGFVLSQLWRKYLALRRSRGSSETEVATAVLKEHARIRDSRGFGRSLKTDSPEE